MLSDEELLRYSRQIMLPELDVAGQEKLKESTVLIVGLGGLGSPVAMYLAAAGVGHLILVDNDEVELTNLQRQIIHSSVNVGEAKVYSAQRALADLNPHCKITAEFTKFKEKMGDRLVASADVILDCSDNFAVRFLLNKLSVQYQVPLVSGAAIRMDGQVSVYDPMNELSPCYHCLFDDEGEDDVTCASNGVLSPVVGIVGSIQATEAIKQLTGVGATLVGKLLMVDALNMRFREVKITKNPDCAVCSGK
jgi:adenylyltransferase/sulfurtransferase